MPATNAVPALPPPTDSPPAPPSPSPGAASPGAAPTGPKAWTAEDWQAVFTVAGPVIRLVVENWRWKVEQDAIAQRAWDDRVLHTLLLLIAFLGGLIVLMAWLTWQGRVSGDALLFLVGAVASWILFATQRYLFEKNEDEQRSFL